MNLSPEEREWIISGDDSTDEVMIYSASRRIINKCKKAGYKEIRKDVYGSTFVTKDKNITFRTENRKKRSDAGKKKVLTPEHLAKMQEGRRKSILNSKT